MFAFARSLVALGLLVGGPLAFGAQVLSAPQSEFVDGGIASEGFRLAILKPFMNLDVKISGTGESDSSKIDDTLGFSVGYANLPVQDLGWTTNLAYLDMRNNGGSAGMARLDGNLAYAFKPMVNIKGGLNVSKMVSGALTQLNVGIGFQAGVGFQFTQNFGIDAGYSQMNQSLSSGGQTATIRESGPEIGLNATF